jgi:hypothetical protein
LHYARYHYTAWGEPIWFGAMPQMIVAVDGDNANRLIPKIQHVIENYKFRSLGAWPGPHSNTFVRPSSTLFRN